MIRNPYFRMMDIHAKMNGRNRKSSCLCAIYLLQTTDRVQSIIVCIALIMFPKRNMLFMEMRGGGKNHIGRLRAVMVVTWDRGMWGSQYLIISQRRSVDRYME